MIRTLQKIASASLLVFQLYPNFQNLVGTKVKSRLQYVRVEGVEGRQLMTIIGPARVFH
jgi:hypothetical protein